MKTVFTYAHLKWFYGQPERAYYLNHFIITNNKHCTAVLVRYLGNICEATISRTMIWKVFRSFSYKPTSEVEKQAKGCSVKVSTEFIGCCIIWALSVYSNGTQL